MLLNDNHSFSLHGQLIFLNKTTVNLLSKIIQFLCYLIHTAPKYMCRSIPCMHLFLQLCCSLVDHSQNGKQSRSKHRSLLYTIVLTPGRRSFIIFFSRSFVLHQLCPILFVIFHPNNHLPPCPSLLFF